MKTDRRHARRETEEEHIDKDERTEREKEPAMTLHVKLEGLEQRNRERLSSAGRMYGSFLTLLKCMSDSFQIASETLLLSSLDTMKAIQTQRETTAA